MEAFPAHLKIKSWGYTVVELAVVIGVAGVLLTIGLYGYRGFEHKAQLRGEQRALMNHLLLARNEALTGVLLGGTNPTHNAVISSGSTYSVDGRNYNLTNVEIVLSNPVTLCFFHPSQDISDVTTECNAAGCQAFACIGGGSAGSPVIIRLHHENLSTADDRCIQIEGSGLRVNRIYEVDCP